MCPFRRGSFGRFELLLLPHSCSRSGQETVHHRHEVRGDFLPGVERAPEDGVEEIRRPVWRMRLDLVDVVQEHAYCDAHPQPNGHEEAYIDNEVVVEADVSDFLHARLRLQNAHSLVGVLGPVQSVDDLEPVHSHEVCQRVAHQKQVASLQEELDDVVASLDVRHAVERKDKVQRKKDQEQHELQIPVVAQQAGYPDHHCLSKHHSDFPPHVLRIVVREQPPELPYELPVHREFVVPGFPKKVDQ
mmetsp:Transcript_29644/g.70505  ORF Transcript_29644/g.70505 Transcript_29644/m.70505 type:complete len:245 (-) Transcript_29644:181-915(-)